jgi:Ca2+/Na+ antiporter
LPLLHNLTNYLLLTLTLILTCNFTVVAIPFFLTFFFLVLTFLTFLTFLVLTFLTFFFSVLTFLTFFVSVLFVLVLVLVFFFVVAPQRVEPLGRQRRAQDDAIHHVPDVHGQQREREPFHEEPAGRHGRLLGFDDDAAIRARTLFNHLLQPRRAGLDGVARAVKRVETRLRGRLRNGRRGGRPHRLATDQRAPLEPRQQLLHRLRKHGRREEAVVRPRGHGTRVLLRVQARIGKLGKDGRRRLVGRFNRHDGRFLCFFFFFFFLCFVCGRRR